MKQLQSISVVAPGFSGINTQDSGVTLAPSFALEAFNCVIDRFGRLGARKGWTMQTTDGGTELSGNPIEFVFEHVNADNTRTILSGGNLKLFSGGVGAALTDITPAAYTISANNWKAATLNDYCMIVQKGQEPIFYSGALTPVAQKITDVKSPHTPNFGTSYPHDVLAAFGRFWVHDGKNVYWSTDLADADFPKFQAGSSGSLNIASVLPNNVDTIIGIAAHNNFLIIFCENNIVIYNNADDPLGTGFGVADVIAGVGCIARDSIQTTGSDLIFLSHSGIRSLGRIIQEKSLPMRDLSVNVRDQLDRYVAAEPNKDDICSVYSEEEAFYLLSFPASQTVFCVDMRRALEDGSARILLWNKTPITAMHRRLNRTLLLGKTNGIGLYDGYRDNGVSYRMTYKSSFIDFQDSTITKVLKKVNIVVFGGRGQEFQINTGADYRSDLFKYQFTIETGMPAEWGISEWNIMEWSAEADIETINTSVNGAGKNVQVGFSSIIDGVELSVQRIDLFVKTGRMS